MRHFIIILAALLPIVAHAAEKSDTTRTADGKTLVIDERGGKTVVQMFDGSGSRMTKTREVEFVDGQEIERVYVTSPFIPKIVGSRNRRLKDHYPFFYIGFNQIPGSIMGAGGNTGIHTKDSKSWEWGIMPLSMSFGLTNSMALTSALSIGKVHNHFQDNYVMTTADGQTYMRQEGEGRLRKSYISYTVVRLPVMVEWQKRMGRSDLFVAAGPSLEMRWNAHSRYRTDEGKHTETDDINLCPLGVNLELRAGYGCLTLYGRASLTPLLKKSCAPACYPVAFGIGIGI